MTMRVVLLTLAVVVFGSSTAVAQVPHPNFAGVYMPSVFVGSPTVVGPDVFPLTDAGQVRVDAFSEFDEPNQADDCAPSGMPNLLWHGTAMQVSENEGDLVFHYERGNTIRSISMDSEPAPSSHPVTPVGYSTGRWEGSSLVIETTHLAGRSVRNNHAQPLSDEATLTERYWREPGSNDLNLELTIVDPVYYTEPFTMSRDHLEFSADGALQDWVCVSLGSRDGEELDIDELARMLEEL